MPTEESFSSEDSSDTNAADSLEVGQMVLAYQDVMGPDVPPLQRAQVKEVTNITLSFKFIFEEINCLILVYWYYLILNICTTIFVTLH